MNDLQFFKKKSKLLEEKAKKILCFVFTITLSSF